jgi:hypothetical protein
MKHLTVADKSLLLGDEVADLIIEYAKLLGQVSSADSVELNAISGDGDQVLATFLLNGGLTVMTETTTSSLPEPDNAKAEEYLHTQIVQLREQNTASPEDISGEAVWNTADTE